MSVDVPTTAPATPITDHASAVAAAQALVPLFAEHARAAEVARRPADQVVDAVRASGLFAALTPGVYGGAELDLDTLFEIGVILGEGDASAAWITTFYVEHNWMLCQFPESFQRALYADRNYVLAPGMISPAGTATPVDGGFVLDGRWQWGTGIVHADWVIAGAIDRDTGKPRPSFYALPIDQCEMLDTWHTDGMSGTGSHDVVIHETFVPADRRVDVPAMMAAAGPGAQLHEGLLYRTPMAPILSLAAAGPVLGQARFAVREYAEQLQRRYDQMTLQRQADNSSRQVRLAHADMVVRSAEMLFRSVIDDVMERRIDADEHRRVGWTTAIAHAVGLCREAVGEICEAAGAGSHFLDNPLQRSRRDLNTMACHTVFDLDQRYRALGRSLVGLRSESLWH